MTWVIRAPENASDHEWLQHLWEEFFGGEPMVVESGSYYLRDLPALLAEKDGNFEGAVSWTVIGTTAEIVSLNALVEGQGLGSALLERMESLLQDRGVDRVVLTTTNDNIRALAFYQKRGFRFMGLRPGAVDLARQQKPAIPEIADNGIPIHDEILLEKNIKKSGGSPA